MRALLSRFFDACGFSSLMIQFKKRRKEGRRNDEERNTNDKSFFKNRNFCAAVFFSYTDHDVWLRKIAKT